MPRSSAARRTCSSRRSSTSALDLERRASSPACGVSRVGVLDGSRAEDRSAAIRFSPSASTSTGTSWASTSRSRSRASSSCPNPGRRPRPGSPRRARPQPAVAHDHLGRMRRRHCCCIPAPPQAHRGRWDGCPGVRLAEPATTPTSGVLARPPRWQQQQALHRRSERLDHRVGQVRRQADVDEFCVPGVRGPRSTSRPGSTSRTSP